VENPIVYLSGLVTLVLYTAGLGILSVRYRQMQGLRWFFASLALSTIKTVLQCMKGSVPDSISVLFANILVTLSFYAMYRGFCAFVAGKQRPLTRELVALALGLAIYTEAYYLGAPFSNAIWAVPVVVLFCTCIADLLSNREPKFRIVCRVTVGLLAIHIGFVVFKSAIKGLQLKYHSFSEPLFQRMSDAAMMGVMFLETCLVACYLWFFAAELHAELNRVAATDALTGALNRRALEIEAARELARSGRTNAPLSLILLDIDHFKQLNDSFGHPAGDAALCALVDLMKATLRSTDVIARTGGEEFLALLPGTDVQEAQEVAERLRQAIEALRVPVTQSLLQFTASMGVAQVNVSDQDFETVRERADQLLYQAKRAGRNRVISDTTSDDLAAQ
jgi:diguanylate cyclase (GGDEF)-like protein